MDAGNVFIGVTGRFEIHFLFGWFAAGDLQADQAKFEQIGMCPKFRLNVGRMNIRKGRIECGCPYGLELTLYGKTAKSCTTQD